MPPPTDSLAAAKAILNQPADDIGSAEIEQALALALVAAADHLGQLVRLLENGTAHVVVVDA
jgi:hypothetical protein